MPSRLPPRDMQRTRSAIAAKFCALLLLVPACSADEPAVSPEPSKDAGAAAETGAGVDGRSDRSITDASVTDLAIADRTAGDAQGRDTTADPRDETEPDVPPA